MSTTVPRRVWAMLSVVVSFLAIPGVFTLSRIFFVRDLASSFLPHHLWFRRTVLEGQLPFWNPYLGCGFSTLADPVFQTFFPLTLPLRLLPSTIGFNLIVALPVGVAALGTYRFLRRHASRPAAALGGIVFAASGPFLSTASMPNLAWSCALIPWVLTAIDGVIWKPTARRIAVVAAVFGVMVLAGEPVTFAATVVLATAYGFVAAPGSSERWRPRVVVVAGTLAAVALGVALAAIQVLPAAEATHGSIRAAGKLREMWSLHPARLIEAVSPFFFGKYVGMPYELTQWLFALNDSRGPLLISLYVGVPVLLLALLGAIVGRRSLGTLFWCAVAVVALVAALGSYTPIYPALQRALPVLALLRYPSKYLEFSTFAVAVLAAWGWDALFRGDRIGRRELTAPLSLAALLAVVAVSALLVTVTSTESALAMAQRLATTLNLPNPTGAAHSLTAAARAAAPRLLVLSVVTGVALVLARSARREASFARGALFALIGVDLILANAPINPTIDATVLAPFDWVGLTRQHPEDRVFVSRDFTDDSKRLDDSPVRPAYPPDRPPVVYTAVYDTALGSDLSASAVHLTLSKELTGLRPVEYFHLLERFGASDRASRYRFLSWAGTRYFLVAAEPPIAAVKLTELPGLASVGLYDSTPAGSRVFVAPSAVAEPDPLLQIDKLFEPGFALDTTAIIDHEPPPPAASAGPAGAPQAAIVEETTVSLLVEATAPEGGGYLLLLDSFDPNWKARVDGRSVPILRADGVFRGVRLPAGRHEVRFVYRPRSFVIGATISCLTAIGLGLAAIRRPRLTPRFDPPRSTP